jgi:hypothetical protein
MEASGKIAWIEVDSTSAQSTMNASVCRPQSSFNHCSHVLSGYLIDKDQPISIRGVRTGDEDEARELRQNRRTTNTYCDSDLQAKNATGMPLLISLSLMSSVNKYPDLCTLLPSLIGTMSLKVLWVESMQ